MARETPPVPPVVMFMGPPGSGKGTQALAAEQRFGFARVETGAILRELREESSPRGQRVRELIDQGHLAPPPLVAELIVSEVRRHLRGGRGVALDGSPRSLYEAEELLKAFNENHVTRLLVVALDVPKPETVQRVLQRWVCVGCRQPVSVSTQPSPGAPGVSPGVKAKVGAPRDPRLDRGEGGQASAGVAGHSGVTGVDSWSSTGTPEGCAACGGELVRRDDDTVEGMTQRWEAFTFQTAPVIEYFGRKGFVTRIDGHRPIPEVVEEAVRVIQEHLGIP